MRVLNITEGCILNTKGDEIELCKNCPDWKYRSWEHNYWKIVKKAEERRKEKPIPSISRTWKAV